MRCLPWASDTSLRLLGLGSVPSQQALLRVVCWAWDSGAHAPCYHWLELLAAQAKGGAPTGPAAPGWAPAPGSGAQGWSLGLGLYLLTGLGISRCHLQHSQASPAAWTPVGATGSGEGLWAWAPERFAWGLCEQGRGDRHAGRAVWHWGSCVWGLSCRTGSCTEAAIRVTSVQSGIPPALASRRLTTAPCTACSGSK